MLGIKTDQQGRLNRARPESEGEMIISELKIYDRALSQKEVLSIYRGKYPVSLWCWIKSTWARVKEKLFKKTQA